MKKTVWMWTCALALCGVCGAGQGTAAARWKDPDAPGAASAVFALADGTKMRVDALAENLFRVRRCVDGTWTESGLNRYGVLARAWPGAKAEWKTGDGFRTPAATLAVDRGDGTVRLASAVSRADLAIRPRLAGKGYEVVFPLDAAERIYGLGDVCRTNIMRRGAAYEIWVKNVNSYIPIPMAISGNGWGVLMNTTWRNVFDVGCGRRDAMVCRARESPLDFYVFTGRDYRALLDVYTRLTGRPALLPAFGYGFTYVCNDTIDDFGCCREAAEFRDRGFPCDVIGLEPGWMSVNYDGTTKKKWHPTRFTDRDWAPFSNFSTALRRMGFKLSLWLCCDYDLFRYEEQCAAGEARRGGRMPDLPAGVSETWMDDRIGSAAEKAANKKANARRASRLVDAGAGLPEGQAPWFEHLKKFVQQGAQCFKLDGCNQVGEHPGRAWANGMTDEEAHNLYPLVYGKQMARGFEDFTKRRAMVYSAGGYAGVQQYVATWAGDTGGGERPCASLINLGASGHSNQSCDMDIFNPKSLHFGFLQTWSQLNNWAYWNQPWYQDEEKQAVFRAYGRLRYRLFPYLYAAAAHASRTGWPVMRALALAYPEDPAYDACMTTYMLGDNLLVGAFKDTVQIPSGIWHEWRTGETVVGPAKRAVPVSADWGGALYVRGGAVVPTWPKARASISGGWCNTVRFEVWPSADGTGELYEDDGLTLAYREGVYALVPLAVKKTAKGAVFTVGRRHGTEKGTFTTPGRPDYSVAFHVARKPSAARVDGRPAEGAWDEKEKTFVLPLGAVPAAGCAAEIEFAD